MRASCGGSHDFVELAPPAEFLTAGHRSAKWALFREPSPESARYPSAGVVQVVRGVHEVEDRLFDEGVRERAAREALAWVSPGRDVDRKAGARPDTPIGRNRHVDQRGAAMGKTVQLGGRLMAQPRALTRV